MQNMCSKPALSDLVHLSQAAIFEPAEEVSPLPEVAPCGYDPKVLQRVFGAQPDRGLVSMAEPKKNSLGIQDALMPSGKRIRLLKTLLTSACERNCFYCPFRAGRDFRRATFKPHEMAQAFAELHRRRAVEGLFLSSGIVNGGMSTQDKLIDTVAILRKKHAFGGYVHLKLMPGCERDQVLAAMRVADRVSINLEAPSTPRLAQIAPRKAFEGELWQALRWAAEFRRTLPPPKGRRWASLVTQFIVGAAGESDAETLHTTERALREFRLSRVYFSAFHPVSDTPLENAPAESAWREHRLYQASFLLRDYGFTANELPFDAEGRLPLNEDPKLAWGKRHLSHSPVEVNRANRELLLRVPGIGLKGAEAIVLARRQRALRELSQLAALGVNVQRALPFILLDGRRPAQQLALPGMER